MFWKFRKGSETDETKAEKIDYIELPPLDDLEAWVLNLVIKLDLKRGEFTFLPAYGGIILFIKNEGLSWIPYSEIQEAFGELDKNKLVDSTATLGSVALAASNPAFLPAILVHRILKGSYRVLAKPSPKVSMSFLNSMIDKVIIEETKLREGLLNTFEEIPYTQEKQEMYSTYVIKIKRKFLDKKEDSVSVKLLKGIMTFISGTKDPIFAIPPQSDVSRFSSILETNGIPVEWIKTQDLIEESTDDYEINDDL